MAELTNSEVALMGLVAEGQKYGYQIEQTIEARGMREWTEIGFSSIYYALNRLEQAGLLVSSRTESGARPGRRLYELTGEGWRKYKSEVLDRLAHDRPYSGDFDLALANLPALGMEGNSEVRKALEERRRFLAEKSAWLEARWEALGRGHLPAAVDALFDHSLMLMQSELAWMDRFLEMKPQNTQKNTKESQAPSCRVG